MLGLGRLGEVHFPQPNPPPKRTSATHSLEGLLRHPGGGGDTGWELQVMAMMGFQELTLELDGCRLHYRRGGQGAPLLYLHGANGAANVAPFMTALAEHFDVIVPEFSLDLPDASKRMN